MKPIVKIIYGTGGGNTQLVCEAVAKTLSQKNFEVLLERAEIADLEVVTKNDALILAAPTYGEGVLESVYFAPFFQKIQKLDFSGHACAVIGLGDPKYGLDYCLESANILEGFFREKKAKLVCPALRVVKTPINLLETQIKKWAENFGDKLLAMSNE